MVNVSEPLNNNVPDVARGLVPAPYNTRPALNDVTPVPPLATPNVPASVIVPAPVIGPPVVVKPVVPPLISTDVTVPTPPITIGTDVASVILPNASTVKLGT